MGAEEAVVELLAVAAEEAELTVVLALALPVGVASGLEVVVSAEEAEDVLEVQGVVAEPSVEVAAPGVVEGVV